jgi:nitrate reductase cytochrome c-type subunit
MGLVLPRSPSQMNYGYEQDKHLDTEYLQYINHKCGIPHSLRSYSDKQTTNKCHTYNNHITKIRLIIPKSSISRLVLLIVISFSLGSL